MRDYTDDIKRYHSGDMTPEERHALEREALNDPFLADALEGTEGLPAENFVREVAELNRQVELRVHRSARPWWQQSLRIAAAILMLALATYGIILIWPDTRPGPIALEQPVEQKTFSPELLPGSSDTLPISSTYQSAQQSEPQSTVNKRQPLSEGVADKKVSDEQLTMAEEKAEARHDMPLAAITEEAEQLKASEKAAAGAQPQPAVPAMQLRSEPATNESDEVIITNRQRAFTPGFSAAHPEGGLQAYRQYLEQSLQYPREALERKVEGRVVVEFVVEPDGSLSNMKVIQSVGSGLDEELMRLIREGPRWLPAKQNTSAVRDTVRVQLNFRLPK